MSRLRHRTQVSTASASTGATRPCAWPGCAGEGEHRAPRSRHALTDYLWYCLEHIRQYNAAWNYYAGMTEREVEAEVRRDTVWQRPSWPLGGGTNGFSRPRIHDGFAFFYDGGEPCPPRADHHPRTREEQAMIVFDLRPPVDCKTVKERYKVLVKRHHPDANGGDKAAEEKFKEINDAYRIIMASLGT